MRSAVHTKMAGLIAGWAALLSHSDHVPICACAVIGSGDGRAGRLRVQVSSFDVQEFESLWCTVGDYKGPTRAPYADSDEDVQCT